MSRPVRILSRSDVERLLDPAGCVAAVEDAFARRERGAESPSGVLGVHVTGGGFHVKAAALALGTRYFAAKVNANFPANPVARGLPTIQGVLVLSDAESGEPLAVMDSMSITTLRTAAATAVAARHLAVPHASSLAIVGCGVQARAHVAALGCVRTLSAVAAYDADRPSAERFVAEMTEAHGLAGRVATSVGEATAGADLVVTCTPSRTPFLAARDVAPGAFVAAVGADNEDKSEITPRLMRLAAVVVDDLGQCAAIGDLHHAIEAGAMPAHDVRATLAEVVADPSRGRRATDEIIVFDSTGVAIEDVAAAAVVYERAVRDGVGLTRSLGD